MDERLDFIFSADRVLTFDINTHGEYTHISISCSSSLCCSSSSLFLVYCLSLIHTHPIEKTSIVNKRANGDMSHAHAL